MTSSQGISPKAERGETLVGLMVGLSVGLVVLAAGSSLLANHLRAHRMALQDSHLHQDLRSAMDWMARELRKTQYSAKAWQTRSPQQCQDAFCGGLEDFSIDDHKIQFSHDRNHDGQQDNNECMGFRLSGQALQVKRSCSGTGDWQAITDKAHVVVTALRWQMVCERLSGAWQRLLQMRLTAHRPGDAGRPVSLSHTVLLRNDVPAVSLSLQPGAPTPPTQNVCP